MPIISIESYYNAEEICAESAVLTIGLGRPDQTYMYMLKKVLNVSPQFNVRRADQDDRFC